MNLNLDDLERQLRFDVERDVISDQQAQEIYKDALSELDRIEKERSSENAD